MIYLDNAATTRPDAEALKKAEIYLSEKYFNPSALYSEGFSLKLELSNERKKLLSYIANPADFDIIFTSCGTEADNTAVFSCGKRGNVVTTSGEHSAILNSVNELKNRGLEVRFAPLNTDGSVNIAALKSLIDEKTSLVSVIHVNNETGAVNPVNEIAKEIKSINKNAVFHTDGVQSFGKIPFKLSSYIDLYSLSAHKIGGIKGVGALVKRKSLTMRPFIYGGGQEGTLRSGTENVFGIMDLCFAADKKFAALNEDNERISSYREYMLNNLNKEIFTPLSPVNGSPYILSVSAKRCRGEILLHILNDMGVIVGTGSACSSNSKTRFSRVILACGYNEETADTVLRISFSPLNTKEEIIFATECMNKAAYGLYKKME